MTPSMRARALYEIGAGLELVDRIRCPYRIAYVTGMDVIVHDLRSGRRKTLYSDRERHLACPLAWSPDGKTVFHSYDQLLAIDVRSRKVREVTAFRDGDRFSIIWRLQCSPDGKRLVFLHHGHEALRWRIFSVDVDGSGLRQVSALENVARFACDWRQNELLAQTALGSKTVVRIDLESGETRWVSNSDLGFHFEVVCDGREVVYEQGETVWLGSLDGAHAPEPIARGRCPSVSPDGARVAFMRGEDEVYIQSLRGGEAKLLLRARIPPADTDRRMGSYGRAPLWSPDGKLLCLWSTLATRHDEPRNPEWVESLRRRQAEYERERVRGVPTDPKTPFSHFAASIENAHWEFEHSVGIVDFAAGSVWLTRGYWQDAAWAPVTGDASR